MAIKCNAFFLFRSNLGLSGIHQTLVSTIAANLWEKMQEDGSAEYWREQAVWLSKNQHLFENTKSSARKQKGVPKRNPQGDQPVAVLPLFVGRDEDTQFPLHPFVDDAASGNSSTKPCSPALPFTFLTPSPANKHDHFPSHVPAEPTLDASIPQPRQDVFATGHAISPTSGEWLPQPANTASITFQQDDNGSCWRYSSDPLIVKDGHSGQPSMELSVLPAPCDANIGHRTADSYQWIAPSQANVPLPSYEQPIYDGTGSSGRYFAPSENTTPSDTCAPCWLNSVPSRDHSSESEFY